MSALEKAVLEELDKKGQPVPGSAVAVQFNPTSLKLQMTNSTDGAASRGRQTQQYNGSASTTLSVQLEFDTADEGTTGRPVDVRSRTEKVARFVLPGGTGSKQAPPRVQFRWGTVIVGGVMTSMSEELTLFSVQGRPLRASVSVEIKQQDPKFEALERGPGANPGSTAAAGAGAGPGSAGTGGDRTAEALDGESAADFLARNGLAPAAWRAIAGALDDPLSLSAGLAVDFSASLSVEAGIGVALGFGAELDVSAGVSLGLEAGAGISAGLALAGSGGVTAAAEALAAGEAAAAADSARASFAAPAAPAAAPAADPRAPLAATPTARTLSPVAAPPRPLPPRADPRATSFGRGVPLRDRVVPPEVEAGTGGWVVVAPRSPARPGPAGSAAPGGCGCGACGGSCGGCGR